MMEKHGLGQRIIWCSIKWLVTYVSPFQYTILCLITLRLNLCVLYLSKYIKRSLFPMFLWFSFIWSFLLLLIQLFNSPSISKRFTYPLGIHYHHHLDCQSMGDPDRIVWLRSSNLSRLCDQNSDFFQFGIFVDALNLEVTASQFFNKYCYCLWWGLRNLR